MMNGKSFLLVFTIVCIPWVIESFDCPAPLGQCEPGIYPDNENCSFYFHCFPDPEGDGCLFSRQQCPDGLFFDWLTFVCALPQNAFCFGEQGAASFAALNHANVAAPVESVPFNQVYPNLGNHWNAEQNNFQAPLPGVYFISLSAGAKSNGNLEYVLTRGGAPYVDIRRLSTNYNGVDTTSRDIAVQLSAFDVLNVASNGTSGLNSDSGLQTSISVFSVTDTMTGPVAFSVGRNQPLIGAADPFPFNVFLVNEGQDYDELRNEFIPPAPGIYFFSLSVGLFGAQACDLDLMVNDAKLVHLYRNSTTHDDVDTTGRSIMLSLTPFDVVHIANGDNRFTWSDSLLQTSFSGFRYLPQHGDSVAWSVGRSDSWSNDTADLNPVEFDRVFVNTDNDWAANRFTAPYSGYFYIHISTGALPGLGVDLAVLLNDAMVFNILRTSTNHNGVDPLSRSGIVYMNTGDVLTVRAARGTGIFSDDEYATSFMGMLLYTDEAVSPN